MTTGCSRAGRTTTEPTPCFGPVNKNRRRFHRRTVASNDDGVGRRVVGLICEGPNFIAPYRWCVVMCAIYQFRRGASRRGGRGRYRASGRARGVRRAPTMGERSVSHALAENGLSEGQRLLSFRFPPSPDAAERVVGVGCARSTNPLPRWTSPSSAYDAGTAPEALADLTPAGASSFQGMSGGRRVSTRLAAARPGGGSSMVQYLHPDTPSK